MSVHGEYARALADVLDRLVESDLPGRADWLRHLDGAHANETRDLSTAARCARTFLERIEPALEALASDARATPSGSGEGAPQALPIGPDHVRLRDACHHLRAHCQAILGGPALAR